MESYIGWLMAATVMLGVAVIAGALASFRTEQNADKRMFGWMLAAPCLGFTIASFAGAFTPGLEGIGHIAALGHAFLMTVLGISSGYSRRWYSDRKRSKR